MILVGGGSRSGKTRFALELAKARGGRLAYIATAEPGDDEMRQRAAAHRRERGPMFTTIEEPLAVAEVIKRRGAEFDAMVIDCLTLWLSNLMLAETAALRGQLEDLAQAARQAPALVIAVTNEVGCGIVPENALARRFRDEAGWMNQRFAEAADQVYWVVFGCPLKVKG